jgi:DNA-binding CsgD family transcriptional regulator
MGSLLRLRLGRCTSWDDLRQTTSEYALLIHCWCKTASEHFGFGLLTCAKETVASCCYVQRIRRWNWQGWSHLGLGGRTTEVLYWLSKGKTNKEIAIILGIAAETVKTHLKDIYLRLHLENRATAAAMISAGLIGA